MRKVKVLAFVLAALMVVAAFAGCGTKQLKTDVSTLDERVTALETLLKQVSETVNGGATKDDITEILDAITANKAEAAAGDKTLADAIAKITADQATANAALKADLEKLVDAAKKDQAAGDTALQVAIEKLNNSIDATNKALADAIKDLEKDIADGDKATLDAVKDLLDDQSKDIADALEDLKETIDKNKEDAGVNATVQAKASAYVSSLTTAKTAYDLEEYHYTASDFAAIEKAIADGIVAIQAATTVEAVDAAYAAVVATLAKYERVDVALYNAYKALMNKINFESKDAIKAYATQVSAAKEHYDDESAINAYVYAAGKTVNLVAAASSFSSAFNYLNSTVNTAINNTKSLINGIGRVQYYTLGNKNNAVSNASSSNSVNVNTEKVKNAKAAYDNLVKELSKNDQGAFAAYLDDALIEKVDGAKLEEHINTVNELAKADALLPLYITYDYATGVGYNNIFGEYLAIVETSHAGNTGGERSWFNTKANYDKINARIDAWRAANPIVDDKNAEAMLNNHANGDSDGNFYKTYRNNETKMLKYVAKYDEFVSNLLPRIKAAQKFTEISTENVQTYIDIRKDIEAWLVVTPDGSDADKLPDLVIDAYDVAGSQYMKMVQAAFKDNARTATFVFEETTKVAPFFADKVAKAEKVAATINKQIEALAADDTSLSAEACKRLEGYVLSADGKYYSIPTSTATPDSLVSGGVVALGVTIADFKAAFVETVINGLDVYSYDLTYLLDLDVLEETEAAIAARVADLKVKTAALTTARTEILTAVAKQRDNKTFNTSNYGTPDKIDTLINKVTLNQKEAVDALNTAYTALIADGFKQDATREWAQYKVNGTVQAGKYTNNPILSMESVYEITDLIKNVKTLNDFQSNLTKFVKLINKANTFAAFNIETIDTELAWTAKSTYTVWNADANKNDTYYKWSFIKDSNKMNDGKTGFTMQSSPEGSQNGTTSSSSKPTVTGAYTVLNAIEHAWVAYAQFVTNNGNANYAALDTAFADNGMDAFKLIAIKNKAWEAVAKQTATPAAWSASYGDYATQLGIVKNAIKNASSVEAIAEILHGFYGMTKVEIGEIYFADVLIFHADGDLHYVVKAPAVCPNCAY